MKSRHLFSRRMFCLANLGWSLSVPWIAAAAEAKIPRRVHSVTGLKRERADYYIKLHANAWPGVLRRIKESNIRNYSVALKEIEGKLYLFSYFEYVGENYEADMAKIAADPETQRWWKETDPCQIPLPDAKAEGKIWSDAKEVFYSNGS
jgi:L-rhamnose mutarotase